MDTIKLIEFIVNRYYWVKYNRKYKSIIYYNNNIFYDTILYIYDLVFRKEVLFQLCEYRSKILAIIFM